MDPRVLKFQAMWTTDRNNYLLVVEEAEPGRFSAAVIDTVHGGIVVLDDEKEVVAEVFANMRKAGVAEIPWSEYKLPSKNDRS